MRIALFTEVFLPKVDGVVTRLRHTLAGLEALGHEVLVLAPGDPPARYGAHRVVPVRAVPFRPWYPEILVSLPTRGLARAVRDFRPDVVHAVNPVWLAAYGVHTARRLDLPLVASFHTDIPAYTTKLGLSPLRRPSQEWIVRLHRQADVNICTSSPLARWAGEVGMGEVELWPRAVDTRAYSPDRRTRQMRARLSGGHPEAPLLVYVGRLSKEKDLDQLLEPVRRLAAHGVRAAFVGSGPFRAELERMFAGTPTVFTGYLSGEELAAAHASADVFAFPSTTDTLGLVALEAAASGVPVVGADAGGIPDVVQHGRTGFLVRPGDTQGWVDRLGSVLLDPAERARLSRVARADAEQHTWAAATQEVARLYDLARRRHGGHQEVGR